MREKLAREAKGLASWRSKEDSRKMEKRKEKETKKEKEEKM